MNAAAAAAAKALIFSRILLEGKLERDIAIEMPVAKWWEEERERRKKEKARRTFAGSSFRKTSSFLACYCSSSTYVRYTAEFEIVEKISL